MSDLVANRIRQTRLASGMTQKTLAIELGVSATYLNMIELGKRSPNRVFLERLGQIFDVDTEYFFAREETHKLQALLLRPWPEKTSPEAVFQILLDNPDLIEVFSHILDALDYEQQMRIHLKEEQSLGDEIYSRVHNIISQATAIRSAANIIFTQADISPSEAAKFSENIQNDSEKLSNELNALSHVFEEQLANQPAQKHSHIALAHALKSFDFRLTHENYVELLNDSHLKLTGQKRLLTDLFYHDELQWPLEKFADNFEAANRSLHQLQISSSRSAAQILRRYVSFMRIYESSPVDLVIRDHWGHEYFQFDNELSLIGHKLNCANWPIFESPKHLGDFVMRKIHIEHLAIHSIATTTPWHPLDKTNTQQLSFMAVSAYSQGMNFAMESVDGGTSCIKCTNNDCIYSQFSGIN